ncbi:MAG: nitrate transporter substrate-binding protein [Acidimicrobiia bacterium]|nr:nitrate transporter substrate-binding protein [Acidimicrobiia bacterium]
MIAKATTLVGLALVMGLAACGDDGKTAAPTTAAAPVSAGAGSPTAGATGFSLKGVCPDKVVVQTDWFPESEHGATFELLGPGYKASKSTGSVTGPLVFEGHDTGVQLEIRGGGPLLGAQNVTSQLYQDPSILLGYVNTDEAIKLAANNPTVAVVAPQDRSPMAILWRQDKHPNAKTIADIVKEVKSVSVFAGTTFADYLVAAGLVPDSKVDRNYQGDKVLSRSGDTAAQQGFITSEPYQYSTLATGPIPVAYELIDDTGWRVYPEPLAVKASKLTDPAVKACLAKLVPMFQHAQIDYAKDPAAADAAIIATNKTYDSFWHYGAGDAAFSLKTQLQHGIIANGSNNTLGDFDTARVDDLISKARPLFSKQGVAVPASLKATDIVTNQFIDPTIAFTP